MTPPTDEIVGILADLVGFDTTSRNSNLDLIAWVEARLDRFGVPHRRIHDATGTKANLWATIGPPDVPGTVLSGHTDVVPVDGQTWTTDPFVLRRANGRLYGRGTTDMKGFLACCLAMVPAMTAARLARPIHLAFSYDEEVGCVGVRGLLAELADVPVKPNACFVGEPTGMQVVTGHKGKRSLVATIEGRTVHSSLAPLGVNAVEYGARLVAFVHAIGARLAARGPRDDLYDVPHSTAHTGIFRGGTALNIVPDRASLEFEFRTVAGDDPDALVAEVERHVRTVLEPEMQAVAPQASIRLSVRGGFPGLETAVDAEVTALARRLALRNDHAKVAYGTEAGLFQAMAGIPTVIVGPGAISEAHIADEFVEVAELERCVAFIGRLIEVSRA